MKIQVNGGAIGAAQTVTPVTTLPHNGKARPRLCRFLEPMLPQLEKVVDTYKKAHADGFITNAGLVTRFEQAAAERLGVRHCVAVSSCTSGLMLVLRALGVSGEVILPSFTFFATGHAVLWNGLQPVFADCHAHTWNIDPAAVERQITEKTSAILAVHLYGNPCDLNALTRIASNNGLKLIIDAAHGFGSLYGGRPIGQFGDAEVFSLTPTKLLVAGEGGLVATNDTTLARLLRAARNYGDLGAYDPEILGLSARMSEFAAALALASLEMLDAKVQRRNQIAGLYTSLLASLPGLGFQAVRQEDLSTYKDYSIHINAATFGLTRDQLADTLKSQMIETKKYFYPPLHKQQLYKRYYDPCRDELLQTTCITDGVISLPIYESMSDEVVEHIVFMIQSLSDGKASTLQG